MSVHNKSKSRSELSPLDGRYKGQTSAVAEIFSERALVGTRIEIELAYLDELKKKLGLNLQVTPTFDDISIDRVFEIENMTKHDVKAVEMAIREKCATAAPWIHFGLTSQDVNSLAVTSQTREGTTRLVLPAIRTISEMLSEFNERYKDLRMLSHTHGQPATPTTLGEQFMVFAERLDVATRVLSGHKWTTKFGGATGGFNAHKLAFPDIDWNLFGDEFIAMFSEGHIMRQQHTTQIEHYDGLSEVFDAIKRCATVLIDFCSDVWHYIHLGYLKQAPDGVDSIGSSTMPHKINPIQFENAEGNLQLAVALLEFMSRKLPISRLQRDLTDSTVTRNIGVAFGHIIIGTSNIIRGLKTVAPNETVIRDDLARHPEVITEGIQTLLRSEGYDKGYDDFKTFTRENPNPTLEAIRNFVKQKYPTSRNLDKMLHLTPENY